ncbi:hypothetical protein K457DRAFT_19351 [Linnemannia elongata AG-77]|uniref:Uncharacterized protein n=1 Tax=Linnemannia elongata AG-77 TaxID=1314771 RepID=A0A197JVB2_9FUNG|nr:hypothetical protein K457DRAFT_19351 [Linnemannia elongata AG-77]
MPTSTAALPGIVHSPTRLAQFRFKLLDAPAFSTDQAVRSAAFRVSIKDKVRTADFNVVAEVRTCLWGISSCRHDGETDLYDPNNERTIPIATKPDAIERDLPNLKQTILIPQFMKLGYLVMRNSGYRDINMPWDKARQHEEDFSKSSPLWSQCEKEIAGLGPPVLSAGMAKSRCRVFSDSGPQRKSNLQLRDS